MQSFTGERLRKRCRASALLRKMIFSQFNDNVDLNLLDNH